MYLERNIPVLLYICWQVFYWRSKETQLKIGASRETLQMMSLWHVSYMSVIADTSQIVRLWVVRGPAFITFPILILIKIHPFCFCCAFDVHSMQYNISHISIWFWAWQLFYIRSILVRGKIRRTYIFLSTPRVCFSLFSGKTLEAKTTRLLFHHLETITSLGTNETTRVNTLLVRKTIFVVIIMKYSKKLSQTNFFWLPEPTPKWDSW